MKYLISACLIGENVKYNGGNNYHIIAKKLYDRKLAYSICPEVLGGLPIPRVPAEIVGHQIISKTGIDVTKEYHLGAKQTLKKAQELGVKIAILQARSPSCGSKQIYDGTHTGTLINGEGVTTALLKAHGITVITLDEYIRDYYEEDFN